MSEVQHPTQGSFCHRMVHRSRGLQPKQETAISIPFSLPGSKAHGQHAVAAVSEPPPLTRPELARAERARAERGGAEGDRAAPTMRTATSLSVQAATSTESYLSPRIHDGGWVRGVVGGVGDGIAKVAVMGRWGEVFGR